mmetsp:Transcript_1983/g.2760  ORF Transcript_1983/g.2760 Transcript_1983/m.2760 type:complete len:351 (+) Transcript_1983:94-1146(+)|eukprot:CAMPEP_0198145654 /NCGR_PEP_ID=MMETSP1443-20131203/24827_1 /TAXON_ID=186043 /ORGANISM="Entomoneis sp., Strain CCMP2396" /LENGTH=350 /DNA_ID=CAMNT_0043809353 /DNA_START=52 /DNA_END=1104 /DNA_ORIENTATION=-
MVPSSFVKVTRCRVQIRRGVIVLHDGITKRSERSFGDQASSSSWSASCQQRNIFSAASNNMMNELSRNSPVPTATNNPRFSYWKHQYRSVVSQKNPLGVEDPDEDDFDPKKIERKKTTAQSSKQEIVLYERIAGDLSLARNGFWFVSMFSGFWVWYAVDFVPVVNNSGIEGLQVHPAIPAIGLTFGFTCQVIVTLYPIRLLSKLTYQPPSLSSGRNDDDKKNSEGQLCVYRHSLPFIRPSTTPHYFPVGNLTMDAASREAQVLTSVNGFHDYKGYIPLFREQSSWWHVIPFLRFPYLLDIKDPEEVRNPDLLLKALLTPDLLSSGVGTIGKRGGGSSKKVPSRRKTTKRR